MTENALSILIIFSVQLQQTEISERKLFIFHLGLLGAFKKKKASYAENWTRDIYLNVYVLCEFWAARNVKKMKFWIFQDQPAQLWLFHPYFLCKSSFRVISMIKMVI